MFKTKSKKKVVLVLSRNFKHTGGVANYIRTIIKHFDSQFFDIEHFAIGKRSGYIFTYLAFLVTIIDGIRLYLKLFNQNYIAVHLNPSLGFISILRDGLFCLITKLHKKKALIFWHGWNIETESRINKRYKIRRLFRLIFDSADATIVLSHTFKQQLRKWGFCSKIYVETTTFDDDLIQNFSPEKKIKEIQESNSIRILFLSRIEVDKGIFETIDAFTALSISNRKVELVIAGDGSAYNLVKKYVVITNNKRIKMVGYVMGAEKRHVFETSHLLCFPTKHGEGLPVSILEAMAFGMPIITRPVGGIRDIIVENINGYFIPSLSSESLSKLLKKILSNQDELSKMIISNYRYAKTCFPASIVAKRIDNIYYNIIFKGE
jgi:glycosyltransferase involved in cell wall biosynthesis